MKKIDAYTSECLGVPSLTLMKNAGARAFARMDKAITETFSGKSRKDIKCIVLCGSGNNGGDGYVVAQLMNEAGYGAVVVSMGEPSGDDARICRDEYLSSGAAVVSVDDACAYDSAGNADVIIDAVFGTGFHGVMPKRISDLFACINRRRRISGSGKMLIFAVDMPSGVNSDDGSIAPGTPVCDLTCTFFRPKAGLCSYPAYGCAGEVFVEDIGIPEKALEVISSETVPMITDDEYVRAVIPERRKDSHKGSYGHVLVLTGSTDMTGAASLSVIGALRSGAGLVTAASSPRVTSSLKIRFAEPLFMTLDKDPEAACAQIGSRLADVSSVVFGCGSGVSRNNLLILEYILNNVSDLQTVLVDADGITMLASLPEEKRRTKAHLILTPHPGEASRLLGTDASSVNASRIASARLIAEKYRATVALKGAHTVVTDGEKLALNPTGNPGMARGGSGDLLAGLTGGLAAQGITPFDAAVCGTYIHGLAGDIAAEKYTEYAMLAGDEADEIASAFLRILGKRRADANGKAR